MNATRTAEELYQANKYFYNKAGFLRSDEDAPSEYVMKQVRRDFELMQGRQAALDAHEGPRVGDFIIRTDGRAQRFSYDWGDGLQTADSGSFYMSRGGYGDFSGALDPVIPRARIEATEETRAGAVWFFSQDYAGAARGVHCRLTFRVYRELPA